VLSRGAIRQLDDITDLVALLIPGNRNQQHAAARILLALKAHGAPMAAFAELGRRQGISRRTLERTRAKLAQLGVIERITWMHRRFGGQSGWVLSSRMTTTLRQLADLWEDVAHRRTCRSNREGDDVGRASSPRDTRFVRSRLALILFNG
jgi:DNA-binding HxlR family transcriptional regulator